MSLKCKLNLHSWNNCICKNCGKVRDKSHYWHYCICLDCGKKRDENHKWNGCKCLLCGKTRNEQHDFYIDCERCSICGQKRDKQHVWDGCICSICGKGHNIIENSCSSCGIEQIEGVLYDEQNNREYKTIKIGTQWIMAENYAYPYFPGVSSNNKIYIKNSLRYGYLYSYKCFKDEFRYFKIPKGWHVPTVGEWKILYDYLGGEEEKVFNLLIKGGNSGFNALCGAGWIDAGRTYFANEDEKEYYDNKEYYWSSTPCPNAHNVNLFWFFLISKKSKKACLVDYQSTCFESAYSIRLFKDN